MGKLRVVIARPGEEPEDTTIENSADSIRRVIGGWFEGFYHDALSSAEVMAYINEEGRIKGEAFNFISESHLGGDVLGPAVFVSRREEPEECDLDDDQVAAVIEFVKARRPPRG